MIIDHSLIVPRLLLRGFDIVVLGLIVTALAGVAVPSLPSSRTDSGGGNGVLSLDGTYTWLLVGKFVTVWDRERVLCHDGCNKLSHLSYGMIVGYSGV
jgi:hypothetical protein